MEFSPLIDLKPRLQNSGKPEVAEYIISAFSAVIYTIGADRIEVKLRFIEFSWMNINIRMPPFVNELSFVIQFAGAKLITLGFLEGFD